MSQQVEVKAGGNTVRRVRTAEGARKYGQPIGSVIVLDVGGTVVSVQKPGQSVGTAPGAPAAPSAPRKPKTEPGVRTGVLVGGDDFAGFGPSIGDELKDDDGRGQWRPVIDSYEDAGYVTFTLLVGKEADGTERTETQAFTVGEPMTYRDPDVAKAEQADAPAGAKPKVGSAAAGELRARMAARADDETLDPKQRENARAIADDSTVEVVAGGSLYVRLLDAEHSNTGKAGWVVGDPGSGLTFGAPSIVGTRKEATALAERFADLRAADGSRLGDVDNIADVLRTWKDTDGNGVGRAVLRARGEHDIARGKPNSEWAQAFPAPAKPAAEPEPKAPEPKPVGDALKPDARWKPENDDAWTKQPSPGGEVFHGPERDGLRPQVVRQRGSSRGVSYQASLYDPATRLTHGAVAADSWADARAKAEVIFDNPPSTIKPKPVTATADTPAVERPAALEYAITTALQGLAAEAAVVRDPVGFIVTRQPDGTFRTYAADAWQRPTGDAPMLPWRQPPGTPVVRVAVDGTVSDLDETEAASLLALADAPVAPDDDSTGDGFPAAIDDDGVHFLSRREGAHRFESNPDRRATLFWAQTYQANMAIRAAMRNLAEGRDALDGVTADRVSVQNWEMLLRWSPEDRTIIKDAPPRRASDPDPLEGRNPYREVSGYSRDEYLADVAATARRMRARVEAAPKIDEPLYRGIRMNGAADLLTPGKVVEHDVSSWSLDEVSARGYAEQPEQEGIIAGADSVVFILPSGAHGATLGDDIPDNWSGAQTERLVPGGFRITAVRATQQFGQRVYEVEVESTWKPPTSSGSSETPSIVPQDSSTPTGTGSTSTSTPPQVTSPDPAPTPPSPTPDPVSTDEQPPARVEGDASDVPSLLDDDLRDALVQAIVANAPNLDVLRTEADVRGFADKGRREGDGQPTPVVDRQPPRVPAGSRLTAVTLPDGTHDYRVSKGRGYTHAVITGPGKPEDRAAAAERDVRDLQKQIEALDAALANPKIKRSGRPSVREEATFYAYDFSLQGVTESRAGRTWPTITTRGNGAGEAETWRKYVGDAEILRVTEPGKSGDTSDDKVVVSAADYLLAQARAKRLTLLGSQREQVGLASAYRRGEGLGGWSVQRWSSRRELAEAAASGEFGNASARGRDVRVVEVDAEAIVDRRDELTTGRDVDPANLTAAERSSLVTIVENPDAATIGRAWGGGVAVPTVTYNRLRKAGLVEQDAARTDGTYDRRLHLTDAGWRSLGMEPRPRTDPRGGWQVGDTVPYVDARTGEESEQTVAEVISRERSGVGVRLTNGRTVFVQPKDGVVVPDPEPTLEPEPEPTPDPEPVVVTPEPDPTPDSTVVPPLADGVVAAEFIGRHLSLDRKTEKAVALRLRGTGTWEQRSAAADLIAAHPQKAALDQVQRLLTPSTWGRGRTYWDQQRSRAALQRWVERDPSLPENTLGAGVQMMVRAKPRTIDVSGQRMMQQNGRVVVMPPGSTMQVVNLQDELRSGRVTEVVDADQGFVYIRMVDDDGDESFTRIQADATMTRLGDGQPRPEPTPDLDPVIAPDPVTPDPEPVTPEPVVPVLEPTPDPEPPVLPKTEGREDVVARDVAVGDRLYEGDGIGEVVDIQQDDGNLLFDLRMDDGSSLSVMSDPSEVLSRVPAPVVGEPEPVVVTPPRPRRRAAATHSGEPVGRPALATYQRRMIVSYAIDADESQSIEAREAALLVRNRKPLTSEQADALAGALRSLAATEKPRRAGALDRAAGRFDLTVDNIALSRSVPDSPVTARRLLAGQRVRIPEYGGNALLEGTLVDVRRQQGGRILTLTIEDDAGERHVRVLLSGTQVTGLPSRIAPPVDPAPPTLDEVVDPEPTPDPQPVITPEPPVTPEPVVIPPQPTRREEMLAEIERNERLYEERLRAERGLDMRWRKVGSDFAVGIGDLQPGDVVITKGEGVYAFDRGVSLPARNRSTGVVGYPNSNIARVVASIERDGSAVVVRFTDGQQVSHPARTAAYAASPADIAKMRAREQARIDEAEADVPTEVRVADLVHGDIVVLPDGVTGRSITRSGSVIAPSGLPGYALNFRKAGDSFLFTFQSPDQEPVEVRMLDTATLYRLPALPEPEPVIAPDPEPRADGLPRPVTFRDLRIGDVVRISEPLTGQDYTGTVQYVDLEDGEDGTPGALFGLALPGQAETSFSLWGDDTISLLERDDAETERVVPAANAPVGSRVRFTLSEDYVGTVTEVESRPGTPGLRTVWLDRELPDGTLDTGVGITLAAAHPVTVIESNAVARVAREREEARVRTMQRAVAEGMGQNAARVLSALEYDATWDVPYAGPQEIANLFRKRRDDYVRAATLKALVPFLSDGGRRGDRAALFDASAKIAQSDAERIVDDAIRSFEEATKQDDESEQGMAQRVMRALVVADTQRVDERDAAALTLARFADTFRAAAEGPTPERPTFTPPTEEQKAARQQAIADLAIEHRRKVATAVIRELGDSVDSKATMKRAWARVGNAAMNVNSGTLDPDDDLVQRALVIVAHGEDPARVASKMKEILSLFRIEGASTLQDIADDLKVRRESSPIEWLEKRYTGREPEVDEGRRAASLRGAAVVLSGTEKHLMTGGDEVQARVDAIEVPTEGALADRVAKVRAAVTGASFGKRAVRRKTFAPITIEQLAAGEQPTIVDTEALLDDKASDGGPGASTLAQLAAVKTAGRLVREEVERRSAAFYAAGRFAQYGGPVRFSEQYESLMTDAEKVSVEYRNLKMTARAKAVTGVLERNGFGIAGDTAVYASTDEEVLLLLEAARDARRARSGVEVDQQRMRAAEQMHPWLFDGPDADANLDRLGNLYREVARAEDTVDDDYRDVIMDLAKRRGELLNLRGQVKHEIADARSSITREVLADLRPMGTDNGRLAINYGTAERAAGTKAMRWAENFYPSSWLEKAKGKEGYTVRLSSRGKYVRGKEFVLDSRPEKVTGAGKAGGTAIHELGHHMEYQVPGLAAAEAAFLFDRTSEGPIGARRQTGDNALTHIANDKPDSFGRKDKFRTHYTGREYAGSLYLEVFTMGVESVFAGSEHLDDDMQDFILGVMATL